MNVRKPHLTVVLMIGLLGLVSCVSKGDLKKEMKNALKEDPSILTEAIEENPADFMMALQKAAKSAQKDMAQKREEQEKQRFEEAFNNPLNPTITEADATRGPADAPLVLVEYSDFECPFCRKGYNTVMKLMDKYEGKIKFVYKHLPLSFHKQAMVSAKYFEALRMQSEEMAWEFHDKVFENQRKLGQLGEKFLKKTAKDVGANMSKLKKDMESDKVAQKIKADQEEAAKFGMQGTPGFIINGVPVKGAYPPSHFEMIINKLEEKGKVNL